MTSLEQDYQRRFEEVLVPAAASLQSLIADHLDGVPRIDRVSARAKEVTSFLEKAAKAEDGKSRYEHPLEDISDQIGVRVVVFFIDDVDLVAERVCRYFPAIETEVKVPDDNWAFGYFGLHFLLSLPADVVPKDVAVEDAPQFFELQVKTLFQHAWSEADHDLGYKAPGELSDDQQRRLAFTAAQAWGADRVFSELTRELA